MRKIINGKILLFMIFFSVFLFGQFSFNDTDIISVGEVNAAAVCGSNGCESGETIFNCKQDCLPAGIPTMSVEDSLDGIIKWLLGFGLVLSVIFLVWGGIYYVGSSGDAQKTETAKKIIKYAILGVFVIGVSFAIISVISTMFAP